MPFAKKDDVDCCYSSVLLPFGYSSKTIVSRYPPTPAPPPRQTTTTTTTTTTRMQVTGRAPVLPEEDTPHGSNRSRRETWHTPPTIRFTRPYA